MIRHTYSLIAVAVLVGPLAFSFEPNVHLWTHWPAMFAALALTGALYLFWGVLVVQRGDWVFNPKFTGRFRLFGLPAGEYLLFLATPYACLFLFEVMRNYTADRRWFIVDSAILFLPILALVGTAAVFWRRRYTFLALLSSAAFLAVLAMAFPQLAGQSRFWIWFALCFAAFLVVGGAATALPVIGYNPRAILGLRVGPIPIENFFYQFSYLGLTLCFYLLFDRWFGTTAP
jgi:lycopene cyclase domain-containing protein